MVEVPFIVDDIILRMLGISIPPFDMIWLFEHIRDLAIREAYDPEKTIDAIKENDILYEVGDITKEEYEQTRNELMEKLKLANRVREMNLEHRTDILNIGD